MSRTKTVIFFAFVLALGAGVAVGMLSSRTLPRRGDPRGSWLIQELELTPSQQEQMDAIWSEMLRAKGREYAEQLRSLQQQREAAVVGLLNDDSKKRYDQINTEFVERAKELWKRCQQDFLAAAEKTRAILNESQREKYDSLLSRFQAKNNGGDWFGAAVLNHPPATLPSEVR